MRCAFMPVLENKVLFVVGDAVLGQDCPSRSKIELAPSGRLVAPPYYPFAS